MNHIVSKDIERMPEKLIVKLELTRRDFSIEEYLVLPINNEASIAIKDYQDCPVMRSGLVSNEEFNNWKNKNRHNYLEEEIDCYIEHFNLFLRVKG
ncbi:MAG: hypothetical protein COA79_21220 [Planctomycetota bacterium]|nr:MAG: hypothetical protein COA79_21220 [Planctomycetota bacterium]